MPILHEEQQLRLRVTQLTWESEGVLSLSLQQPDRGDLPAWRPGAHVDLTVPGPNGALTRQYSLNGEPADRSTWRVSVFREPVSTGGSEAVHTRVRPGDLVDVRGPRNTFALEESPSYLFIAGGIGITPILPMVEQASADGARWSLLYGGRSRSSMAFLDPLARHGDVVRVHPEDEHGLLDLDAVLGEPRADTLVYCCGPAPLLDAVEERCRVWPPGALHVERFTAKPQVPIDPGLEQAFEVVLEASGRTVTVPPGMSVLEALEANGIDHINSCREGICGTCETKVVDGIPDHRDSLLSEEERAAGDTMMICVGRALCPRLVLDL
ncbi:MAG TPA: PDR/VanB family oxidoreductase [Segeticoccus sp.]|uniref:PDR/VanB family oxidoreductase n=1 Tax=Segeticoccus sp. TaxID=2706531 RepID=UPI002D7E7210|nr:PDR/VanB family oxidoreductase [Segeticoccus sp.]HET8599521.1 PDR/VanB family oxidoreductase [Segeticoccus sp.]